MPKKSIIWEFFTINEGGSKQCNQCRKCIAHSGNTTNLYKHLKYNHPLLYSGALRRQHQEKQAAESEYDDEDNSIDVETGSSSIQSPISITLSDSEEQNLHEVDHSVAGEVSSPTGECRSPLERSPKMLTTQSTQSSQPKMDSYLFHPKRKQKLDAAVAYFVAVDMQPYNTVEKQGFNHLMKTAAPGYSLPSRKVLSEKSIPALYSKTRKIIKDKIGQAEYIAFTADGWTAKGNKAFVTLTAHFIINWKMTSVCLNCREVSVDHTGENLAEVVKEFLAEWDITSEQITILTTDSGTNMIKCAEFLAILRISCFGHTMNTGVTHAFELKDIADVLSKVKAIQNKFAHSWKIVRELKQHQSRLNHPQKMIPSFSKTRWWSLLGLIDTVIAQSIPLNAVLLEFERGRYRHLTLNLAELDTLKIIAEVLKPFHEFSDTLAGEKYVTASAILSILEEIKSRLVSENDIDETQADPAVSVIKVHFIQNILNYLEKRYGEAQNSNVNIFLRKCQLVDPRFKSKDDMHIRTLILEEMATLTGRQACEPAQKKKKGLGAIFRKGERDETFTPEERNADEFERYVTSSYLDAEEDPLTWWKQNESLYPKLATLAKKYLCAQATSVPSERVFSRGGEVIDDNRTSLTSEHAEQLIFLAINSNYVPTN